MNMIQWRAMTDAEREAIRAEARKAIEPRLTEVKRHYAWLLSQEWPDAFAEWVALNRFLGGLTGALPQDSTRLAPGHGVIDPWTPEGVAEDEILGPVRRRMADIRRMM